MSRPGKYFVAADSLSCRPFVDDIDDDTGQDASDISGKLAYQSPDAYLNTPTVEPQFLSRLSKAQFDDADLEIANLFAMVQLISPDFAIETHFGVDLLVHRMDGTSLLVLPASGGFCQLLIEELHSTPLSGHLGAQKLLDALSSHV